MEHLARPEYGASSLSPICRWFREVRERGRRLLASWPKVQALAVRIQCSRELNLCSFDAASARAASRPNEALTRFTWTLASQHVEPPV
jgi:hypothetical protein